VKSAIHLRLGASASKVRSSIGSEFCEPAAASTARSCAARTPCLPSVNPPTLTWRPRSDRSQGSWREPSHQALVAPAALGSRSCQPSIEPASRDTEHLAQFLREVGRGFFRMSRSCFSLATSRQEGPRERAAPMPISIRLDPEVHCAVVRRITVFRVAREQCKRHEPLAAVRVSEPR
jgi:hypothetical protein